jgi:aryl-alcohol dehydrogenase-like predicted oxidoreductase
MAKLRTLGGTGLSIAPLVLGGNVFGVGAMDQAKSFAVLDAFIASGGTMIDTADYYSRYLPGMEGGESESMIGAWLADRGGRDRVQISTKGSLEMGPGMKGLSARYLVQAVDNSLRRLRTDYIDLYFSHFDDAEAPQEETAEAYDKLIKAGKLRAIGASNFTPERLVSAIEIAKSKRFAPYTAMQPEYNLLERGFETTLRDICIANNLGVIVFFGLAQGYLTGKYRYPEDMAKSRRGKGVKKYMEGKGPAVLAAMDEIAVARSTTLAAIALAWVKAKPGVTAPIASATSVAQLNEIMPALDLELSADEVARLDAAGA